MNAIQRLLGHLSRFGKGSPTQWQRKSRRWGQRTGGGNTDMRVSKRSTKIIEREYHPTQAERNQRRNRRKRLAA